MRLLLFVLFWASSLTLFSQSKEELQKQRDAIVQEIKYTSDLIAEAKKAQQLTQSEMAILDKQIALRSQLIRSMQREIKGLERTMEANKALIKEKEEQLAKLKKEYAQLIYLAYKHNNSYDKMLYIFAADDFYQAWMRLRHLKDVARYREDQGVEIVNTKEILAEKNRELQAQRTEKQALLSEQKSAQEELDKDKRAKEQNLLALREDEQDLKKKLKTQEKKQKDLSKAIERLIAEELRKNTPKGGDRYALTPEERLSSEYFSNNKGKLPWPVERGVITGSFGTHAHPVLPGIQVTNNGIDITTEKNAMVRTIFEGEVSGIIEIPGNGMAVVVKHGGYRTVYSNLREVMVSKGQHVDTKQAVGVLMDEGNSSMAHMEIWQVTSSGMKKLNPSQWIAR
ncbi:MAG: peptidoglycan DD-metalloendopeptidase family protein [Flavobacteriales bacterium]|nr:peptidoglycan DD-metalloendopeptidase family protein [Flavobacteriales bacterium]